MQRNKFLHQYVLEIEQEITETFCLSEIYNEISEPMQTAGYSCR